MRGYLLLLTVAAFAVQLDLSALPRLSSAAAASLSAEQISEFQTKLQQVEASRTRLGQWSACLSGVLVDQQAQSAERERALGQALARQLELEKQLAEKEALARGFEALVATETQKVAERHAEFARAQRERAEQARRLQDCERAMTFLRDICKLGEDAVKALGWMNDADAEFRAALPRLQQAEQVLNDARRELDGSRQRLTTAQQDHAASQASVREIETVIGQTKTAISTLHIRIHAFNTLSGDLSSTLEEAQEVNPDDARLRQVVRLSAEADRLNSEVPNFMAETQSALPDDARKRCAL